MTMYIMHFIEITDCSDSQVVEVRANSKNDCVRAYLQRNAWLSNQPNHYKRLSGGRLMADFDDEICIMQTLTPNIVTALWIWKDEL